MAGESGAIVTSFGRVITFGNEVDHGNVDFTLTPVSYTHLTLPTILRV